MRCIDMQARFPSSEWARGRWQTAKSTKGRGPRYIAEVVRHIGLTKRRHANETVANILMDTSPKLIQLQPQAASNGTASAVRFLPLLLSLPSIITDPGRLELRNASAMFPIRYYHSFPSFPFVICDNCACTRLACAALLHAFMAGVSVNNVDAGRNAVQAKSSGLVKNRLRVGLVGLLGSPGARPGDGAADDTGDDGYMG